MRANIHQRGDSPFARVALEKKRSRWFIALHHTAQHNIELENRRASERISTVPLSLHALCLSLSWKSDAGCNAKREKDRDRETEKLRKIDDPHFASLSLSHSRITSAMINGCSTGFNSSGYRDARTLLYTNCLTDTHSCSRISRWFHGSRRACSTRHDTCISTRSVWTRAFVSLYSYIVYKQGSAIWIMNFEV